MNAMKRVALWAASLLVSVTLFSLFLNLFFNGIRDFSSAPALLIFRVTMSFALPVWCLYLPWVIALKDAEEQRVKTILFSGILIGPTSMVIWGLILELRGENAHKVWSSDPLTGIGGIAAIVFAFVIGSLATSLYVIALRFLYRE